MEKIFIARPYCLLSLSQKLYNLLMGDRWYAAIDLKSFYASVECFQRGLDPLTTNLVVADQERTDKTICLAVSPTLKQYGLPGRCRLFEAKQRIKEVNQERLLRAAYHRFTGKSFNDIELKNNPNLELDFIIAVPQMAKYIEVSSKIYSVYLRYVSPDDIYVYSIDEVFIDLTPYLNIYKLTPHELTMKMIRSVLDETGITATGGIGTNLYLAKVAMDIVAKHIPADKDGVRIAELDEMKYRQLLWDHKPLTSFWRIGHGLEKRLNDNGMYTMGDVARRSIENEDSLYKLFGINAELIIDHAWGWEPVTIKDIKGYRSLNNSVGEGQVLSCPYEFSKARLVMREMIERLVLGLVEKHLVYNQIIIYVNYDKESLKKDSGYNGPLQYDRYGKVVPKDVRGNVHFDKHISSTKLTLDAVLKEFDRIVDPKLLVRRMNIAALNVIPEESIKDENYEQLDLFSDFENAQEQNENEEEKLKEERDLQEALIAIQKRYGKNAVVKGSDLSEGATTIERNNQIGGHRK